MELIFAVVAYATVLYAAIAVGAGALFGLALGAFFQHPLIGGFLGGASALLIMGSAIWIG